MHAMNECSILANAPLHVDCILRCSHSYSLLNIVFLSTGVACDQMVDEHIANLVSDQIMIFATELLRNVDLDVLCFGQHVQHTRPSRAIFLEKFSNGFATPLVR